MTGPAVGAGLAVGLLADVSIATPETRIVDGHTKLGVAAGDHAAIVWPLLCGMAKAKYHLLLCDEFSAREAHRIGLVQEVVPAGQQVARAMELAAIIARNAPLGIQVTKQAGRKFIEAGEQAAIAVVPQIRDRVLNTADAAEGIKSFIERSAAVFQGR